MAAPPSCPPRAGQSPSIRCSTTALLLQRRQVVRAWIPPMLGQHIRLKQDLVGAEVEHAVAIDEPRRLHREEDARLQRGDWRQPAP